MERSDNEDQSCCCSPQVEVKVTPEEAEIYKVKDYFHTAKFDNERVAGILRKQEKSKKSSGWCGQLGDRLSAIFVCDGVLRRVVLILLFYLIGYYIIQYCYQKDICPDHLKDNTFNGTCTEGTKSKFKEWNKDYSTLSKIITFLLGFYVATIVRGWLSKVNSIPEIETSSIILGLLATSDPSVAKESLKSASAVIEVRRMITRYCLLSWTLCFNNLSRPLAENLGSLSKLVDKRLLTEAEVAALQPGTKDRNTPLSPDLWWIPLTWALNLVKQTGVSAPKDQMVIPKDQSAITAALIKLKVSLDKQKVSQEKKLPGFYRNTITWAIYAWICLGVLGTQNINHHPGVSIPMALLYNFPFTALLVKIVILCWIKITDVLENPYGFHKSYDINLSEELELNIWRTSLTIQNQTVMPKSEYMSQEERMKIQQKLWMLIQPASPAS